MNFGLDIVGSLGYECASQQGNRPYRNAKHQHTEIMKMPEQRETPANILVNLTPQEIQIFWSLVNRDGQMPDEENAFYKGLGRCWEFLGVKDPAGYGRFSVRRRQLFAHRVSWSLCEGPIPNRLCVLHKCDNPNCVRPDHLFLGTVAENNHDCTKKDRRARGDRNGSRLYPERLPRGDEHHARKSPHLHSRGTGHYCAILTPDKVLEMRAVRASEGLPYAEIAKRYGVTRSVARKAILGKTWKILK